MAAASNLEMTAPSSSSSPTIWDVFLSFYGKDTRANFISHLYKALDQAGIATFRDDPALEKGEEISSGLLNGIKDSKMFVVVLSENYARSTWCLNELVEILLSCKSTNNQVVPVFYYVNPSDLRYHKGSFGEAFESHEKRYSVDAIARWKLALTEIAQPSGYHLKKEANEDESQTIQNIVDNLQRQLPTKVLHPEQVLFGTDFAVEEIYQTLRMESNGVRAIGICGIGGIGKTTTALAFYNKYSNRFDISCFIEKVKQYSQGGSPLLPLLEQLLTALLRKKDYKVPDVETGIRQLKQTLCFKKALIVLDDLDQSSCSDLDFLLVSYSNLFSAGSRIIITARDSNLPNQLKVNISEVDIYMLKELGPIDSLQLFSYHAFGEPTPPPDFKQLSVNFVTYARGLPLALKVLGSSSLRGRRDVSFWKAKLEKLKDIPEKGILGTLQESYDELDDETLKSIFLDIAFFFVGKFKGDAVPIFESCGFHPEVGIPILLERCLLTVNEEGIFGMHDLVQDMGKKLGKSTRLFLRGEDLQNQKVADEIECLILDMTLSMEKQINSQIFEKLPKLRLLEIIDAHGINGQFNNSFPELRAIYWRYCTWTELPSSFKPQKLVFLCMPYSNFRILWNGAMPFRSLKTINLSQSVNLEMTPDFENTKLVEVLIFFGCESLLKVHPSITELTGLTYLDLRECTHLEELPEPVGQLTMKQWPNMRCLFLSHCSNLRRLPKQLGDMKGLELLDASHTAIEELPDSITQLKKLVELYLSSCKKLIKLPEQIGNMEGLRAIMLGNTALEQLPDSFVCLINLIFLDLNSCKNLRNFPNSIWKLKSLRSLNLHSCSKLERLPEELGKMQCLEVLNASKTAIEQIPDSIGLLSRLRMLSLSCCNKVKYVPSSVWNLTSLTDLLLLQSDVCELNFPDTVKATKLVTLSLNCDIRLLLPIILRFSSLKRLMFRDDGESLSPTKPFSLLKLDNLQHLELYRCTSFGSSFLELPLSLTHLRLSHLYTCRTLVPLSSLKQLKKLVISNCVALVSLPSLPPHLQSLVVHECIGLRDLPDMSMLKDLVTLTFGGFTYLELPGLEDRQLLIEADVQKIEEWFSYKSIGRTLHFDSPLLLGDDFLGLALWILFTPPKKNDFFSIRAVVTNKTNGITQSFWIPVYGTPLAEEYSLVNCTSGDGILIRSGDNIHISFSRQLYHIDGGGEVPWEEVEVKMCGAHVIQKSPSTPDFPSVLNHLINLGVNCRLCT